MPTNLWPQYSALLAGGWKCISYEMFDPQTGDLISTPHGSAPLGRVLLSAHGYLSAHLARPDRIGALPSGSAWQTGGEAEVARVARGLSMYCGYLELFEDAEGLYWQTRVEVASDPNRVGGWEVRRVEVLEGERGEKGERRMILRPKQDLVLEDGRRARAVLKWEKFE